MKYSCYLLAVFFIWAASTAFCAGGIDRHALVTRHNPVVRSVDVDSPLTVGNGNFAFGCDITGMQTFEALYQKSGVPVEILSRWAWISEPNTDNYTLADASQNYTQADGRVLPFPTRASTPAGDWLRRNPRDLPLGVVSLEYTRADGSTATLAPDDIKEPEQKLDLWTGIVTSCFTLDGVPVQVTTACSPTEDTVAITIRSELVAKYRLRGRIAFPAGHNVKVKNTPGLDWTKPESHVSELEAGGLSVQRRVFDTVYYVTCSMPLTPDDKTPHTFWIAGEKNCIADADELSFTLHFSARKPEQNINRDAGAVFAASAAHWKLFWETTAAVDFTGSTNPLAAKIEERIILSRYLMAAQMAGDFPPQETGLTCSSWYGKHHTEMIWWHAAHFALWGSDDLLARNLAWYQSQLPAARELAKSRGLSGARWAKMTGPEMRESPGGNPLIVWNQPHMVYLCELLYCNADTSPVAAREALQKYRDLVLETAECMASMLYFDKSRAGGRGEYVLGPPLWIAQEIYDPAKSRNPAYELAYWRWALEVAQQWRARLGMEREEKWDHILAHLSPLPQKDGKYVALESIPDTWDDPDSRHDHPSMLMSLGFLPQTSAVDRATMNRTLDAVLASWDWEAKIWGWDYPMIAMTAARLGRPADAVAVLLRDGPNNRYLPTGHCPVRVVDAGAKKRGVGDGTRREIATYFPANGAFLSAVALMIAGWDGEGGDRSAPGFPNDGSWVIRAEGLRKSP